MEKLIINFTPTGMIPTKTITPHVPITKNEIIEQTQEAYELGITLIHLHAREKDGNPTYKASIYQPIIEDIRKYCPNLVICTSLSGRNFSEIEKRREVLQLKPDMGSLTLGSWNNLKYSIINEPETIVELASLMNDLNIKPELEAFDSGMINYSKYLIKKNILKPPYYYNLIFGMISNAQADLNQIGNIIKDLPENSYWALGGVGDYQLKVNTIALLFGGGARIGLEDNIYFNPTRTKLATNINLLKRIHILAHIFDREIMTPNEFREKLCINTK